MTDDKMPPLPEPFGFLEPTARLPAFHFLRRVNEDGAPVYSAEQLRAHAEQQTAELRMQFDDLKAGFKTIERQRDELRTELIQRQDALVAANNRALYLLEVQEGMSARVCELQATEMRMGKQLRHAEKLLYDAFSKIDITNPAGRDLCAVIHNFLHPKDNNDTAEDLRENT